MASFIIWDEPDYSLNIQADKILLWQIYDNNLKDNFISIPVLVELNADRYKEKYLELIYNLGSSKMNGKTIIEHLKLDDDFSFWWTSLLAEKSLFKSESITNIIKLFTIHDIFENNAPSKIILNTNNYILVKILSEYCKRNKIIFISKNNFSITTKLANLYYFQCINNISKSILISILHFCKSVHQLCISKKIKILYGEISFIDNLFHLDNKSFITKQFKSNYWSNLPDYLNKKFPNVVNFIHLYTKNDKINNIKIAHELINEFNTYSSIKHNILFPNYSIKILFKSLYTYFYILFKILFNINFRNLYLKKNINYMRFLENDWLISFFGTLAFHHHLQIHTFNHFFKKLPKQKIGFYLYENQGYEYILNHFWKKNHHLNLVAVSHTTIRYWDLRYFNEKNIFKDKTYTKNLPQFIALNSPVSKKYFTKIEVLNRKLIELEALRYTHLLDFQKNPEEYKYINILVCCDILENVTYKMLDWVNYIVDYSNCNLKVIIKPHPACPANLNRYARDNKIIISSDKISDLLNISNFVFVSNSSSSSIDAYCRNIFVVQMIDGNALNLSPLREVSNSLFASNKYELQKFVEYYNFKEISNNQDYFYLDINFPKWKKLLKKYAK